MCGGGRGGRRGKLGPFVDQYEDRDIRWLEKGDKKMRVGGER